MVSSLYEEKLKKLYSHQNRHFKSMHELAVLYKEQGDYDKAEPLFLKIIEGRRLKLGDTHPHTIESMNNLIALYDACNKPEKAKEWREKLQKPEAMTE